MAKLKTCSFCNKETDRLWHANPKCCMSYQCKKEYAEIQSKPNKKEPKKSDEKSLPELLKLCQVVVNRYVRKRDSFDNLFVCISCEQLKPMREMQAGHFFSQGGHSFLRFNLDNIHGQCETCNCFTDGNLTRYKPNLINKIGIERFNQLVADSKREHKWDREEVLTLINSISKL